MAPIASEDMGPTKPAAGVWKMPARILLGPARGRPQPCPSPSAGLSVSLNYSHFANSGFASFRTEASGSAPFQVWFHRLAEFAPEPTFCKLPVPHHRLG